MAKRWAFIVAAGNPFRPGVGGPAHADADALALAQIWNFIPAEQKIVCIGPDATAAVVEVRLQTLIKRVKKDDELLIYVAGQLVAVKDHVIVSCWDTLPDLPSETGIDLADWFRRLDASKLSSIVAFFDCPGPCEFPPSKRIVGFAAGSPGEISHVTGTPPRGVWASLLIDAFAGRLPNALTDDGRLTTSSLEHFFAKEFRRKLRSLHGPAALQSPTTFGDEEIELATFTATATAFGQADWKRLTFRGVSRTKVKDLAGYRKTFQMPDRVTPRANQFFGRVAKEELQADLDDVFSRVIESFSYRRKDVHKDLDDGSGSIRTPDFEYTIHVELDPEQPGLLMWNRDVHQLTDPTLIRSPAFELAFGDMLDQLIMEFDSPRNVGDFIDQYEERPMPGSRITADPEATWCEVKLAGLNGSVRVETNRLIVKGRPGQSGDLLKVLFQFFESGPASTALAVQK